MPGRPFADATVLNSLGTKIIGDNPLLLGAPAFLDLSIIVIRFRHCCIGFLLGNKSSFTKLPNRLITLAAHIRSPGNLLACFTHLVN